MQKSIIAKSIFKLGFLIAIAAVIFASCTKNEGAYYSFQNSNTEFNGTIYQFLESQDGLYDSMLLVINKIPGLKDSLNTENVTLFAVTNKSFTSALMSLNSNRRLQGKSEINLAIADSAILDSLICRYVIPEVLPTDSLLVYTDGVTLNTLKYGYEMNLKYTRDAASGYLNGGPQQIKFSDINRSIFQRYWVPAYTTSVNIKCKNGEVHVLEGGHEFSYGHFALDYGKPPVIIDTTTSTTTP